MNLHFAYLEKDISIKMLYTFESVHRYKNNIITRIITVVTTDG